MLRRTLLISAVALVGAGISVGAGAFAQENYPTRPITLVVPYAPGGATDIIGRVVAEEVSNTIGQRVIVENRPGAAGSLGAAAVSRADPDGYTLLMGALTSHSINMSLQTKPGFDLKKNFAPITLAGNVGLALVVNPSVEAKSVQELIALAKAQPGKITYASAGAGSPQHLAGEMFNSMAGTKLVHAPYRGSGPAMTDMIGGHVQVMFDTIPSILPHVQGGKLRALGVTTQEPNGLPASPGAASGEIVFSSEEAEDLKGQGRKVILVRVETSPEDIHGMHAAEGILTTRGGMTSHAAVVARGMGKPCVSGAGAAAHRLRQENHERRRPDLQAGRRGHD